MKFVDYVVNGDEVVVFSDPEFVQKLERSEEAKKLLYRIAKMVEELVAVLYSDGESYVYPSDFEISVTRDFDGVLRIYVNPSVEYDDA